MRLRRLIGRTLVGAVGTALGIRVAPSADGAVGPLRLRARVDLGAGGTAVELPPLGRALLATHRGPLRPTVTLTGVDPDAAAGLLKAPGQDASAADLRARLDTALAAGGPEIRQLARDAALRAASGGVLGGALLAAVTTRRPREAGAAALVAVVTLAAAAGRAAATLDQEAWRDPRLEGLLARAPLVLGDLREAPARLATYRDQLAELLATAADVHARVRDLPAAPPEDAIRLVHISDVHLSPLALPLAASLVRSQDAHAVVDTGDLVDWGTPAEDALAGGIAALGVPYVYVKGNHDSDGTARAVARQPNATVLSADGGVRELAGLRFAGMADPRFTPDKTTGDDHAHHRVAEAAARFAEQLRGQEVDVALVHSPAAARSLAGLVPLVLAGDIHRREVRHYDGTTVLVQGTSGGAGLRGVQADPPTPVSLSVLHLDRATRRLWGVDEVTCGGLGATDVSVTRRRAAELVTAAETPGAGP